MTSISSVNNAALLILQQTNSSSQVSNTSGDGTDILKVANGISSEQSKGEKSAASVAGKFALDSAPTTGKIVVEGVGEADSWEEMKELVKNNDKLSESEKKDWLSKLNDIQETVASVAALKKSDLYQSLKSGELFRSKNTP